MTPTVKSRLLDLMSEIAQKMDDTRKIARTACATDEEAERYSRRIDEVLEHVANARATVLATTVDRDWIGAVVKTWAVAPATGETTFYTGLVRFGARDYDPAPWRRGS